MPDPDDAGDPADAVASQLERCTTLRSRRIVFGTPSPSVATVRHNSPMLREHATSPLPDGRDVVVYPRGASFGFVLPEQHTITVNEEQRTAYLAIPDHGSDFVLERVEEAAGELRVFVGAPAGGAHAVGVGQVPALRAYSFPAIQDELERLKTRLINAGGRAQEADAWAQGASHDSHTERLRHRIRELEGR